MGPKDVNAVVVKEDDPPYPLVIVNSISILISLAFS
jgi:hypothetical protein